MLQPNNSYLLLSSFQSPPQPQSTFSFRSAPSLFPLRNEKVSQIKQQNIA